MAEDAYQGNAQFALAINGIQIRRTQEVTAFNGKATQACRQSTHPGAKALTLSQLHQLCLWRFRHDGSQPYINSASFDDNQIAMSPIAQLSNGTAIVTTPAVPDPGILTLYMAEDAYQGNAQFTLAINGTQIGAAQSVAAINGKATQAFSFADTLTATQDIAVSFTNDLAPSSTPGDRNLYVVGAEFNGVALSPAVWTAKMLSNGTSHFSLTVP